MMCVLFDVGARGISGDAERLVVVRIAIGLEHASAVVELDAIELSGMG